MTEDVSLGVRLGVSVIMSAVLLAVVISVVVTGITYVRGFIRKADAMAPTLWKPIDAQYAQTCSGAELSVRLDNDLDRIAAISLQGKVFPNIEGRIRVRGSDGSERVDNAEDILTQTNGVNKSLYQNHSEIVYVNESLLHHDGLKEDIREFEEACPDPNYLDFIHKEDTIEQIFLRMFPNEQFIYEIMYQSEIDKKQRNGMVVLIHFVEEEARDHEDTIALINPNQMQYLMGHKSGVGLPEPGPTDTN